MFTAIECRVYNSLRASASYERFGMRWWLPLEGRSGVRQAWFAARVKQCGSVSTWRNTVQGDIASCAAGLVCDGSTPKGNTLCIGLYAAAQVVMYCAGEAWGAVYSCEARPEGSRRVNSRRTSVGAARAWVRCTVPFSGPFMAALWTPDCLCFL